MFDKGRTICKYFQTLQAMTVALVFVFYLTLPAPVHAHKVYIFAWIDGDTVYTESYFSGKKKVMGGPIRVFDLTGKQLLEGKTNEKGEFSFKIPQKRDLRIVLEATMGHKTEYILKADEMPKMTIGSDTNSGTNESQTPPFSAVRMDEEQMKRVVGEALDARLKPIVRTLAKIQEEKGPGLTEIIGGIGYIFGVMGLILYFKNRKR